MRVSTSGDRAGMGLEQAATSASQRGGAHFRMIAGPMVWLLLLLAPDFVRHRRGGRALRRRERTGRLRRSRRRRAARRRPEPGSTSSCSGRGSSSGRRDCRMSRHSCSLPISTTTATRTASRASSASPGTRSGEDHGRGNALFLNEGDRWREAGLRMRRTSLHAACTCDYDRDGKLDLFLGSGYVVYGPQPREPPRPALPRQRRRHVRRGDPGRGAGDAAGAGRPVLQQTDLRRHPRRLGR